MRDFFHIVTVGMATIGLGYFGTTAEAGCSRNCSACRVHAPVTHRPPAKHRPPVTHCKTCKHCHKTCKHCQSSARKTRRSIPRNSHDDLCPLSNGSGKEEHGSKTEATGVRASKTAGEKTLNAEPVVEEAIAGAAPAVEPLIETTEAASSESPATPPGDRKEKTPTPAKRRKPRSDPHTDVVPNPPEPKPFGATDATIFDQPIEFDGYGYVRPVQRSIRNLRYPR